jgi:hypothetical protein
MFQSAKYGIISQILCKNIKSLTAIIHVYFKSTKCNVIGPINTYI